MNNNKKDSTNQVVLNKKDIDDLNYFLEMVIEDCVQSTPDDMKKVINLLNKINKQK